MKGFGSEQAVYQRMWGDDNSESSEVKVAKQFLIDCVPHVAWGVFCSTNTRLPEWLDEQPHGKIPAFFKLLSQGDERAIAFMDEVAANAANSGDWADECCCTWQTLMTAIRSKDL